MDPCFVFFMVKIASNRGAAEDQNKEPNIKELSLCISCSVLIGVFKWDGIYFKWYLLFAIQICMV